jgi:hypothetical protein
LRFNRALTICCAVLLTASLSWAGTTHSSGKAKKSSAKKTSSSHSSKGKTAASSHGTKTSASSHRTKKISAKSRKGSWKNRGQKAIADDRTREIQAALIRERYLDGEPSGVMDARTKAALTKLQGDNGWQTKVVPDSRALIKLGLGPSRENLLNPDTAAISSVTSVKPGGDPAFQPQR